MKLSLCAIVKNDALVVRRMLDSVVGVVDEIVIADTGSTDDTKEILEWFGEEHPGLLTLLHYEWTNDFSAARNFTLEHATGDWILVVDADEFLDAAEKVDFKSFLENTDAHGVFITQRNYTGSMTNVTNVLDVDVCRVFRKGYEYEGSIHEQIAGNIRNAGGRMDKYRLHLHHMGYTTEYVRYKGKNVRNISMLEAQLEEIPAKNKGELWFATSNLMAEYAGLGEWQKIIDSARPMLEDMKKVKAKDRPNFMARVYKFYINALRFSGRSRDAIRVCKEGLSYYPKFTDLLMMQAETHMMRQEYIEAMDCLKKCRTIGDVKFNFVEYEEGNGTYRASQKLAHCWLSLGDDLMAREWAVKSFSENTEQIGLVPLIVYLTPEQAVLHEMEKVLKTPQRYDEFIQAYAFGGYDDTLMFVEKTEAEFGVREATKRARFAYAVRHGQSPELPEFPAIQDTARMGLWYYEQGDKDKANEMWFRSGALGEFYFRITTQCGPSVSWEIKNVLLDLLAARAILFLKEFSPCISDLAPFFNTLMHTDLLAAFTEDSFLERPSTSAEEAEWKAQVYLTKGNPSMAAKLLDEAYLSNGERTVRGYVIAGDVYKANQQEILRSARKVYPDSKLLSFIWMNFFAPSLVQGVLM